jgi:hypothetical protein
VVRKKPAGAGREKHNIHFMAGYFAGSPDFSCAARRNRYPEGRVIGAISGDE